MKQPIEINIEKIILDGFPATDRHRIGEAIRSELARLFLEQGLPSGISNGTASHSADGGSFQVNSNSNTGQIGSEIAKSVYGSLGK